MEGPISKFTEFYVTTATTGTKHNLLVRNCFVSMSMCILVYSTILAKSNSIANASVYHQNVDYHLVPSTVPISNTNRTNPKMGYAIPVSSILSVHDTTVGVHDN